ncbi:MAG: hypothetical protein Aurels2KO_16300 [Aureliella sp.]
MRSFWLDDFAAGLQHTRESSVYPARQRNKTPQSQRSGTLDAPYLHNFIGSARIWAFKPGKQASQDFRRFLGSIGSDKLFSLLKQ